MSNDNQILDKLGDAIHSEIQTTFVNTDILFDNIELLKKKKLNIMLVGATGAGKSSTINALFDTKMAKVGYSPDPETASIQKFEMDNLVLWDTPGLGDSPENDKNYAMQISNALKAVDENGNLLIDEVLVLVDGSNRDMRTTYELIENVIVPFIGDAKRIVVGINQCDIALKGKYWDHTNNRPQKELLSFLDEKVVSVKNRIMESTNISVMPVYYSALYGYNISKLLLTMIRNIPQTKRHLLLDSLNKNPEIWKKNDEVENYNREIQSEMKTSLSHALEEAAKGAAAGAVIGSYIPVIGTVVGATVGAALGFLGGLTEKNK